MPTPVLRIMSLTQCGGPSSFGRVLPAEQQTGAGQESGLPTVHQLFVAAMRDELPLRQLADALYELHGIRLTPAAARLLSSTDAASGRLAFSQFQRALQDTLGDFEVGAGRPNTFEDQAAAIIRDNNGSKAPPAPATGLGKQNTDISADAFVKQQARLAKGKDRGPFGDNPVLKTNRPSAGNPLASRQDEPATRPAQRLEHAAAASRAFVSGDVGAPEYEEFLRRLGLPLAEDGELMRLIGAQVRSGNVNFTQLSRALHRECNEADRSRAPLPQPSAHGDVHPAAAGLRRYT